MASSDPSNGVNLYLNHRLDKQIQPPLHPKFLPRTRVGVCVGEKMEEDVALNCMTGSFQGFVTKGKSILPQMYVFFQVPAGL